MNRELPNYPVVVIHQIDPPDSGLAACCGLPWHKNPVEREGTTLWACPACFGSLPWKLARLRKIEEAARRHAFDEDTEESFIALRAALEAER